MCPHPPFGRVHDLASTLPALAQDRPPTDLVFSRTSLPPEKKAIKCILRETWRTCPRGKTGATGGGAPPLPSEDVSALLPFHATFRAQGREWVVRRLPVPMAAPVSWVAFWAARPAELGREGRKRYGPLFCRFDNLVISSHALSEHGIFIVSHICYIGGYLWLFDVVPAPAAKLTKTEGQK